MRQLDFRDDDAFYDELKQAAASGEEVTIRTPFKEYAQIPKRFRAAFGLDAHRHKFINAAGKTIVDVNLVAPKAFNPSALYVVGAAAIGVGVGLFFGPAGAAVGAGVGALVGLAAGAAHDKRDIDVEVDRTGKLAIRIRGK